MTTVTPLQGCESAHSSFGDAEVSSLVRGSGSEVVQEMPIRSLELTGFSYQAEATPRLFRFIDCTGFLERDVLEIVSFSDLPSYEYCTVSYVWQGLEPLPDSNSRVFCITGIRDAHPIDIEILRSACRLALLKGTTYLWLDLLCIIQASELDRSWQIERMADLYANCKCCLVLPGGLRRLAKLEGRESTPWALRHWTFQEAVLSKHAECMFEWDRGSGVLCGNGRLSITELLGSPKTAYSSLQEMLLADHDDWPPPDIVFESHQGHRDRLCEGRFFTFCDYLFSLPSMPVSKRSRRMLQDALSVGPEDREQAIWDAIFLRASARPVDAILSTMGLFGISLSPEEFSGATNARCTATIKLCQKYLANGGRAYWLSYLTLLAAQASASSVWRRTKHRSLYRGLDTDWSWPTLDRRMCTFIREPEEQHLEKISHPVADTRMHARSEEYSQRKINATENLARLVAPPYGSMDDAGYLQLVAPSVLWKYNDEQRPWFEDDQVMPGEDSDPYDPVSVEIYQPRLRNYWCVDLGKIRKAGYAYAEDDFWQEHLILLLRGHAWDSSHNELYHIVKILLGSPRSRFIKDRAYRQSHPEENREDWIKFEWTDRTFRIGGPCPVGSDPKLQWRRSFRERANQNGLNFPGWNTPVSKSSG